MHAAWRPTGLVSKEPKKWGPICSEIVRQPQLDRRHRLLFPLCRMSHDPVKLADRAATVHLPPDAERVAGSRRHRPGHGGWIRPNRLALTVVAGLANRAVHEAPKSSVRAMA